MKRERCALGRAGDEGVLLGDAERTAKGYDRMCVGSGRRRFGLRDARLSALGAEWPAARVFEGGEELPVPRTVPRRRA